MMASNRKRSKATTENSHSPSSETSKMSKRLPEVSSPPSAALAAVKATFYLECGFSGVRCVETSLRSYLATYPWGSLWPPGSSLRERRLHTLKERSANILHCQLRSYRTQTTLCVFNDLMAERSALKCFQLPEAELASVAAGTRTPP